MRLCRLLSLTALIPITVTPAAAQERCGETVTLEARGRTLAYSLAAPAAGDAAVRGALALLPGGGGFIDLGPDGCARKLAGNSLIRSLPLFHKHGYITALVDAPSDRQGADGLGGFRVAPEHARDLGRVVADLRRRTGLPVYLVGTSRGAISAVNAASRLAGDAAPDAVVLTSPVTSGHKGARKAWVAQSVFDLDLAAIRVPVLVVAHAADTCVRTPPRLAREILERTEGAREQFVAVEGGPAADTVYPGLRAARAARHMALSARRRRSPPAWRASSAAALTRLVPGLSRTCPLPPECLTLGRRLRRSRARRRPPCLHYPHIIVTITCRYPDAITTPGRAASGSPFTSR